MTLSDKAWCSKCDAFVSYTLTKQEETKVINGKQYRFILTDAHDACGHTVTPRGLIDKRIAEVEEQYYQLEGIPSDRLVDRCK